MRHTPHLDGYSNTGEYFLENFTSLGDVTSEPMYFAEYSGYCIVVTWTTSGSPVGTFKLQGCVDRSDLNYDEPDDTLVNWFDINGSSASTVGNTGIAYEESFANYRWIRLIYTRGSGSITLSVSTQPK